MCLELDIKKIEQNYEEIAKNWGELSSKLEIQRDKFEKRMYQNLLGACDYINFLIKNDKSLSRSENLLELNMKVHGIDENPNEYKNFRYESEKKMLKSFPLIKKPLKFYHQSPLKAATYVFSMALSQPQLFIEGNHRTSSLIVTYMLMQEKKLAFILTPENAVNFLDIAGRIKYSNKEKVFEKYWDLRNYREDMKNFFKENSTREFIK